MNKSDTLQLGHAPLKLAGMGVAEQFEVALEVAGGEGVGGSFLLPFTTLVAVPSVFRLLLSSLSLLLLLMLFLLLLLLLATTAAAAAAAAAVVRL